MKKPKLNDLSCLLKVTQQSSKINVKPRKVWRSCERRHFAMLREKHQGKNSGHLRYVYKMSETQHAHFGFGLLRWIFLCNILV
jgi:cob(I)alamin adenosyltransferase